MIEKPAFSASVQRDSAARSEFGLRTVLHVLHISRQMGNLDSLTTVWAKVWLALGVMHVR